MSAAICLSTKKIGQKGVIMKTYLMNMILSLYKTKATYLFMCPLPLISRSGPLLVTGNDEFFTSRGKGYELNCIGKTVGCLINAFIF